MSLRVISIEDYTLPTNWLEEVKNYDIDKSLLGDNNKIVAKKIKDYILKFEEGSLISKDVKRLLNQIIEGDLFHNHFLETLDAEFVKKVFDEIKNQEDYLFYLKIESLNMEIATMYKYKKNGYEYIDVRYNENNPDITLEKNNRIYEIQVKHKQSIDDFLDSIQYYIEGMSMLTAYNHLQNKSYMMNINQASLNDKEREKAFKEVENFIKNKDDVLMGEYITINNKVTTMTQIQQSAFSHNLCEHESSNNLIKKIIPRIIEKLDKQYKDKNTDSIFIGVIIWSIPFHEKSDFELIKEIILNEFKLPYMLDITLVVNILSEKEPINFLIEPMMTNTPENGYPLF
jgi:hypothetical protein